MRIRIPYAAFGLALVAGAPTAHAQTLITREIADQPVETVITQQPNGTFIARRPVTVQTVQTVETVRTVRPATRTAARRVVRRRAVTIRQTVISERIVPTTRTVVAPAVAATYPQPLYDVALPPAPVYSPPPAVYSPPLYDEAVETPVALPPAPVVAPAIVVDQSVVAAPVAGPTVPFYRYVYEPDRILVIDPNTNIAIEAIPR